MNKGNRPCHFCVTNTKWIDYKDFETLKKFTSLQSKIIPPKRTGLCAKHQRELAGAIKRSRFMSLMQYTVIQK
ncbi:30S ribosomal protein S18 [Candidatus Azambacteria bacterium]|nr:30S ribosomal protein S18 [Candidatus Azambacteria bacterium]